MTVNVGDIVRYLNSVGGGRVVRVDGNMAYVDDEGFETPVMLRECVVVERAAASRPAATKLSAAPAPVAGAKVAPGVKNDSQPAPAPVVDDDEPGGDVLNVVLGFEPDDIKRLSTTTFGAYLVNDSNYRLLFTVATRAAESSDWALRFSGEAEAHTEVPVAEITREDLPEMDRIAVQLVAFKAGRGYALKTAVSAEFSVDTTKFAKLHCFQPNRYFDVPVIAFDVVRDDVPYRRQVTLGERLSQTTITNKDRRGVRPVVKRPEPKSDGPLVVDLHSYELLDTTAGLSPAEIINYQVDKFRDVMDANLRRPGTKIIFIHGKGEGVLRQALMKELTHRYKGHDVQDASFREYGFGATQVTIRGNKR